MNRYYLLITIVAGGALLAAVAFPMRYSQASVLFGVVAAALAPMAIHKIESPGAAIGLLVGLSLFASFPVKKLFHLAEFPQGALLSFAYAGVFWVIGAGWKRRWQ